MSKAGLDLLFEQFPILVAEDLVLREATAADVSSVFSIFSDPEVDEFYDLDVFESPDQAAEMVVRWRRRFESREGIRWAILDHHTDGFLGGCGLTQINSRHRFANMYYWVRTGHTKKGIATRAVRLLARFGCETLALQRIEIVVPIGHTASIRVAEKAGALREGILRNRVILHDVVHDAVMFSFVPQDFVEWSCLGT